jgi:hypothetical protein
MWCRAVHSESGSSVSLQPYGTKDQHINSISRSFLNCVLLDELDRICAGTGRWVFLCGAPCVGAA